MKKNLHLLPVLLLLLFLAYLFLVKVFYPDHPYPHSLLTFIEKIDIENIQDQGLILLKSHQDKLAWQKFQQVLSPEPENLVALWAKAEILRRRHKYSEAEDLLNEILRKDPNHQLSLISLCYIKYHADELDEAQDLAKGLLKMPNIARENLALAYMLMGSIKSKKASKGGLYSKIKYGIQLRGYFRKARNIAPDLAETRLGLGTFYLLAPKIVGGSIDKAIKELRLAVILAPNFATANARLAQAYKKKGDLEKYDFYLNKAKELDPENEVLKEIED